jgi:hypothetical protein
MAMSDDLIFRYVTSTSYPTFTCAECGVALCSHAEAVLSVLHETIPAERTILSDLIAELRTTHYPHTCTDPEDFPCCCQECREHWPCGIEATARSAEARLRDVSMSLSKGHDDE